MNTSGMGRNGNVLRAAGFLKVLNVPLTAGPHLLNSSCIARAQSCPNCRLRAIDQKKKKEEENVLTTTKHSFINYVQTVQVTQTERSSLLIRLSGPPHHKNHND